MSEFRANLIHVRLAARESVEERGFAVPDTEPIALEVLLASVPLPLQTEASDEFVAVRPVVEPGEVRLEFARETSHGLGGVDYRVVGNRYAILDGVPAVVFEVHLPAPFAKARSLATRLLRYAGIGPDDADGYESDLAEAYHGTLSQEGAYQVVARYRDAHSPPLAFRVAHRLPHPLVIGDHA